MWRSRALTREQWVNNYQTTPTTQLTLDRVKATKNYKFVICSKFYFTDHCWFKVSSWPSTLHEKRWWMITIRMYTCLQLSVHPVLRTPLVRRFRGAQIEYRQQLSNSSNYRTCPLWKLLIFRHCREGDQTCTAAGIKTITLQVIYWSYKWPSTAQCQLRSVDGPQNNRC